ncbi:MAG: GAF domain-containing protein [Anaerolineales bacterium]
MRKLLHAWQRRFWNLRSLRAKLLWPIAGLMLISLLGGTITFVVGNMWTRNQLLRQQTSMEAQQVTGALDARVSNLVAAAELLAADPRVITNIAIEGKDALDILNSRAVVVRDRFGVDLIQLYNAQDEARINLLMPSLYRESSLLAYAGSGRPVVRVVADRVMILVRKEIPETGGAVVMGLDLASELSEMVKRYRLSSDLGTIVPAPTAMRISSREDFPFDAPEGHSGEIYSRRVPLDLGDAQMTLYMVRPTTEIQRVMMTGLLVMIGSMVVTTGLLIALSLIITRAIAAPIHELSTTAGEIAAGDLARRVEMHYLASPLGIGKHDEIGSLAATFNGMVDELEELYEDLEAKVDARTHELSMAADIARAVSSSLDLNVIMEMSIHLIRTRLDIHYVGVFLPQEDDPTIWILSKATGLANVPEAGRSVSRRAETLISEAIKLRRPIVLQDLAAQAAAYPDATWWPEIRAAVAIPLLAGREVIGVLDMHSCREGAFTPERLNLLQTLADQIAIGLQNAQLYKSEQKRRRFAEILELTGRALSGTLDMSEVPGRILTMLKALIPYERGSLWMRKGDHLTLLAHEGYPQHLHRRVERMELDIVKSDEDVFQRLVETQEPLIVDDVVKEPGWRQTPWLPLSHSWLGVPIIAKGDVIGMVSLTRHEPRAFSEQDGTWVRSFAMQAGVALENASLYADIANFNEQLEQMVAERTEELHRAYHVLEQLDRTKRNFINVAAHELRTPLTVIKAYGQMLTNFISDQENPRVERALHGLLSGADRLHVIVNNMLDVAKIENQVMKLFKARVDILDLLYDVRNSLPPEWEERQISLTFAALDELPGVPADRQLLFKVFFNLFTNAIKYTPDGGEITIWGRVDTSGKQSYVEVVVSDNGIGIDPDQQDLIFEKFYQTGEVALHSSGQTKFKGGGPGLGLAIVRGIVLAHGGDIWVESEGCDEERCPGSDFYVRLPLEAANEGAEGCDVYESYTEVQKA